MCDRQVCANDVQPVYTVESVTACDSHGSCAAALSARVCMWQVAGPLLCTVSRVRRRHSFAALLSLTACQPECVDGRLPDRCCALSAECAGGRGPGLGPPACGAGTSKTGMDVVDRRPLGGRCEVRSRVCLQVEGCGAACGSGSVHIDDHVLL